MEPPKITRHRGQRVQTCKNIFTSVTIQHRKALDTGVLSLTFGSCARFFADLFNHANLALITLMTESAQWFAFIPHGYMKAPPVPLWAALVFYGVLPGIRFLIWVYAKESPDRYTEGEE